MIRTWLLNRITDPQTSMSRCNAPARSRGASSALQCFNKTDPGNTFSLWIRASSLIKASVNIAAK